MRPHFNSKFFEYFVANHIKSIRFSFALAISLFIVSVYLDLFTAPQSKSDIWSIKFELVTPLLFAAFMASYFKFFIKYSQVIMFGMSMVMGYGVLGIIFVINKGELASQLYYSGLALCIIWTHTILRLRFWLSILSTALLITAYNLCWIFIRGFASEQEWIIFFSNNFFMISAALLSAWSSFTTERVFKRDYLRKLLMIEEKDSLVNSRNILQEKNSAKSRLLSVVSKDISIPIRSVRSVLSLHSRGAISNDEIRNYTRDLLDSVDSSLDVFEHLLSWSCLQIEDAPLNKEKINLYECVSEVFAISHQSAQKKGNRLVNNVSPDLYAIAEPITLKLIIKNLVSNSIKFTEDGFVELGAVETEKSIQIFVKDNGSGIPDDIAKKLFQWNEKISTCGTQKEKGHGLGLLLSKEFIKHHGGTISYITRQGRGTTFTVTIPMPISSFSETQITSGTHAAHLSFS